MGDSPQTGISISGGSGGGSGGGDGGRVMGDRIRG